MTRGRAKQPLEDGEIHPKRTGKKAGRRKNRDVREENASQEKAMGKQRIIESTLGKMAKKRKSSDPSIPPQGGEIPPMFK